jgi:hypothetical protein
MLYHEKSALLEKYQQQVHAYSAAVRKMREYGASLPEVELQLLCDVATRAHWFCDAAYCSLQKHMAEHKC